MADTATLIKIKVATHMMEGVKTEHEVRDFHPFHMDQPPKSGGTDSAPNPMEYILCSLGGCETSMIRNVANKMGIGLDSLSMDIEGVIDPRGMQGDEDVSPHFQTIRQTMRMKISNGRDKADQMMEMVKARCPAYNLMKDAGIELDVTWNIE